MLKKVAMPLAAAAAVVLMVAPARGDGDGHKSKNLRTELKASREVPVVVSGATGSFRARIADDGMSFDYELDYEDFEGAVTQSHIHLGQAFATGGISVWLCQTDANPAPLSVRADTPVCGAPGGDGPEASGTISAADVIGPVGQAVPVGAFADLMWAIRTGNAYVNVHSTSAPGGEVRGQLSPGGHSHHDHDR
jgi:hypothetical protein